jgi:hypothetical protein
MATIRIALAAGRGSPRAFLHVDTNALSPRQLRVVREYLPLDKKSGHPILRAPDRKPRSADCCFPDVHGELKPITFAFQVPAGARDADAPALLDRWQLLLDEARARRKRALQRVQKVAQEAHTANPAELRAGRTRMSAGAPTPEPVHDAHDGGDAALPQRAVLPEPCQHGEPGSLFEGECCEPPRAPRAGRPTRAGFSEPVPAEARHVFDDLAAALSKLPRLIEFEVESFAGPDALLLACAGVAHGRATPAVNVRRAVIRIERFEHNALHLRTVVEDLRESFGQNWADSDCEEDLGLRIDQARSAAQAAWAEFKQLLIDRDLKPGRSNQPTPGLAQMLQLARQIRIDLDTAQHSRADLAQNLTAHPAPAARVVKALDELARDGVDLERCATLSALHAAFEAWSRNVGVEDACSEASRWASTENVRRRRALQHQVRRARLWLDQLQDNAVGCAGALAVMSLGC